MATRNKGAEKIARLLAFIFAALFVAIAIFAIFFSATLSIVAQQLVYIITAVVFALALGVGSNAFFEGQYKQMKLTAFGPWVCGVVVYLLLYYFVPTAATQNVRFVLQHKGVVLEKDFDLRVRIPRMEEQSQKGHRGGAAIELPSQIKSIKTVAVDCPGYGLRDAGPYKIEDGVVYLEMRKTESPPPPGPADVPPIDIISDKATREQVAAPPVVPFDRVTLMYRNMAPHDVELYLLDFSRHYKIIDEKIEGGSPWVYFPIDAKDEFEPYNNFVGGTGWYGLVVKAPDGKFHYLGTENLFRNKLMSLTISPTEDEYTYELK